MQQSRLQGEDDWVIFILVAGLEATYTEQLRNGIKK